MATQGSRPRGAPRPEKRTAISSPGDRIAARAAICVRRRAPGLRAAQLRADALAVLRGLGILAELSIALVGDDEMRSLNAAYRGRDEPTDVLSFELNERPDPNAPPLLGDVVISVDTAARQAARRGVPLADEARALLVHGVLHLLGYDHERSRSEARRMFALQRKVLRELEAGRSP